ncbi:hypothetical protein VCHA53O466_320053 [Vibrio chagasii]|nr:hypothetical protein VCHA53O466_320053 [Vibrio chagasii]
MSTSINFSEIAHESGLKNSPDTEWWLSYVINNIKQAIGNAEQNNTYRDPAGYVASLVANIEGEHAKSLDTNLRTLKSLKQFKEAAKQSLELFEGLQEEIKKLEPQANNA